jgi:hypothetical protein
MDVLHEPDTFSLVSLDNLGHISYFTPGKYQFPTWMAVIKDKVVFEMG